MANTGRLRIDDLPIHDPHDLSQFCGWGVSLSRELVDGDWRVVASSPFKLGRGKSVAEAKSAVSPFVSVQEYDFAMRC